jgi:hypothetical protein
MRFKTVLIAAVAAGVVVRYLLRSAPTKKMETKMPRIINAETALAENSTTEPVKQDTVQPATVETSAPTSLPDVPATENLRLGLLSSIRKIPRSALFLTAVYLSFFAIPELIERSGLDPTDPARRFGVGMFLTTYASLGYFLFKSWVLSIREKKPLQYLDTDKRLRPFSAIMYTVIIIAGLAVFYVSWEGDGNLVGLPFGIGAFISGFVFRYGPKRLIEHDYDQYKTDRVS